MDLVINPAVLFITRYNYKTSYLHDIFYNLTATLQPFSAET